MQESRPVALLTGERSWAAVSPLLNLPLVVQAEPYHVEADYLDTLAEDLPPQVGVVYGVGGGMVADAAKYVGWKRGLAGRHRPDRAESGRLFHGAGRRAHRWHGQLHHHRTRREADHRLGCDPRRAAEFRGAAIVELLTIVTGILDWSYAAERNKTTRRIRASSPGRRA